MPIYRRKDVIAMIKRIKSVLVRLRVPVRAQRRQFNARLLDQRREDVFVLMHQQRAGLN